MNLTDSGVALDRPDVVAEVRAAFDRYERALAAGDVPVLTELFWDDARCVRFGVADRQQGAAEIAAWRATHPSVPAGRALQDTHVLAVDDRTAVVTTLFGYPDGAVEGRQSQTWVRFAQGWRIVAAHVSEMTLDHKLASEMTLGRKLASEMTLDPRARPGTTLG